LQVTCRNPSHPERFLLALDSALGNLAQTTAKSKRLSSRKAKLNAYLIPRWSGDFAFDFKILPP